MPSPRRRLSFPISSSSGFSSPIPYPPRGGYHGLPLSGSHFFLHKKSPPLSAGFHFFALNRPVGSRGSSSDRPFQHHRFPAGDDLLLDHQIDQPMGQFPVSGRLFQPLHFLGRKQAMGQVRREMKKRQNPAGPANLFRLLDQAVNAPDAHRLSPQNSVDMLHRFQVKRVHFRFQSQASNWFFVSLQD